MSKRKHQVHPLQICYWHKLLEMDGVKLPLLKGMQDLSIAEIETRAKQQGIKLVGFEDDGIWQKLKKRIIALR